MTGLEHQAKSVFLAALDRAPDQWPGFLREACYDDAELRGRVDQLLRAHQQLGTIRGSRPTAGDGMVERPGTVIGPYTLLEQIGEGGMGAVFLAEQTRPVRRRVALKVIKAGMDTRQVIARFEAERQALALMDHPNIARVLDAGATDSGRPYFVMELVRGVPITDYCDRHSPTLRQRVDLFVAVCLAVQHAHTKGVIHRDIKPTNILVTEVDGVATPKVIDFGVAKATAARLTDGTSYTTAAQFVGTPMYMSPEQAESAGGRADVDTRSDVYSLGAVLYELLTGVTPFDAERLRAAGYDEVRRVLREEEPPHPSAVICRGVRDGPPGCGAPDAAPRSRRFRGELDWIVLKALEKDRERRYQTAGALAADLRRYLNDEPVTACPPSATYRLRKWARRNKAPFAAASVALVLIVCGIAALGVSNARTRLAQGRAESAQSVAEERADEIRRGLERLQAAHVRLDRGRWYFNRARWDDADAAFTQAIDLRPDHASAWAARGDLYAHLGLFDLAAPDVAREVELSAPDNSTRWLHHALLRLAAADPEGCRRAAGQMRHRFAGTLNSVAAHDLVRVCLLTPQADDGEGADEARRLVTLAERLVEYHPSWSYSLLILGTAQVRAGQGERAVESLRRAIAIDKGEVRLLAWPTLAIAYHRLGRPAEARDALAETATLFARWNQERVRPPGEPWIHHYGASGHWPVAWWDYLECDLRYAEARQLIEGRAPAPDDGTARLLRARALAGLRRSDSAVREYEAALALSPRDDQVRLEAHRARAYGHAMRASWPQAADEYVKATELQGDDINLWRFRAIAQFAAGDHDAYRKTCSAIVERFGETVDPMTACRVVAVCVLSGDALADPASILPAAEVAARQWHFGPWVRGAALYRAGAYRQAIECLVAMSEIYNLRAWEWCFLAMAQHRVGNAAEARRCLGEAARWIDAADRHAGDDPTATEPAWGDWPERPVYRRLLAEATELIERPRP